MIQKSLGTYKLEVIYFLVWRKRIEMYCLTNSPLRIAICIA